VPMPAHGFRQPLKDILDAEWPARSCGAHFLDDGMIDRDQWHRHLHRYCRSLESLSCHFALELWKSPTFTLCNPTAAVSDRRDRYLDHLQDCAAASTPAGPPGACAVRLRISTLCRSCGFSCASRHRESAYGVPSRTGGATLSLTVAGWFPSTGRNTSGTRRSP